MRLWLTGSRARRDADRQHPGGTDPAVDIRGHPVQLPALIQLHRIGRSVRGVTLNPAPSRTRKIGVRRDPGRNGRQIRSLSAIVTALRSCTPMGGSRKPPSRVSLRCCLARAALGPGWPHWPGTGHPGGPPVPAAHRPGPVRRRHLLTAPTRQPPVISGGQRLVCVPVPARGSPDTQRRWSTDCCSHPGRCVSPVQAAARTLSVQLSPRPPYRVTSGRVVGWPRIRAGQSVHGWAQVGSNHRPLACKAKTATESHQLPESIYVPELLKLCRKMPVSAWKSVHDGSRYWFPD
jgi:hypothetical protein